jgi:hypothetical protein
MQSTFRIKRVRICDREHKQVELLDDEPERDHAMAVRTQARKVRSLAA